jgi:maleylacetoacetate isomerase
MALKLYTFFRNSAGYRVRIALHLKGLAFDYVSVNIRDGQQHDPAFRAVNPLGLIPALEHDGQVITQSLAIIEYLEELAPSPALLPADPVARARSRAFAAAIAAESHALNNMRVHKFLEDGFALTPAQRNTWYRHWAHEGLKALEAELARDAPHAFAYADHPTLADIFLVPQIYNYRNVKLEMDAYPRINRIVAACEALEAFRKAAPEAQPDYIEGQ